MKKRSILVSAALTIALCLCLIAGSTYAIFTSSDAHNIAVTSGTVKLTASMDGLNTYTELTDGNVTYQNDVADSSGAVLFENGGYAKFNDDHNLDIVNMTPGDGVNFTVTVDNSDTNVAIQYRVVLTVSGELGPALKANITDTSSGKVIDLPVDTDTVTGEVVLSCDWTYLGTADLANFGPLSVNIFFPNGEPAHDNLFQNKTCSITVRFEAVQGNADVTTVVVP